MAAQPSPQSTSGISSSAQTETFSPLHYNSVFPALTTSVLLAVSGDWVTPPPHGLMQYLPPLHGIIHLPLVLDVFCLA